NDTHSTHGAELRGGAKPPFERVSREGRPARLRNSTQRSRPLSVFRSQELGHSTHAGENGSPPGRTARPPTGRTVKAVNGWAPGFEREKDWPAGTISVSPGASPSVRPSSSTFASPVSATKISSRSSAWGVPGVPAGSVIRQTQVSLAPRLGAARPRTEISGSSKMGAVDDLMRGMAGSFGDGGD